MVSLFKGVKKGRWLINRSDQEFSWLTDDDLPADAMLDLITSSNCLSVWDVPDPDEVFRVVSALAAKRDNLQNYDYVLFDDDELNQLGIPFRPIDGTTLIADVNHYHRDIYDLSLRKVFGFAEALRLRGQFKRLSKKKVGAIIADEVRKGNLDLNELTEGVRSALP